MGSHEVKRRIEYNSWGLGVSNGMDYGVIDGMGKTEEGGRGGNHEFSSKF